MNFGEKIKYLSKTKGTTPANVLRELNINHSAVTAWKKKNQTPVGDTVAKLADYFGVTTDYLLGRTDECGIAPGELPLSPEHREIFAALTAENLRAVVEFAEHLASKQNP
jgi:transcriptional regulator with XRE-family HTH domain